MKLLDDFIRKNGAPLGHIHVHFLSCEQSVSPSLTLMCSNADHNFPMVIVVTPVSISYNEIVVQSPKQLPFTALQAGKSWMCRVCNLLQYIQYIREPFFA